MRVTFPGLFYSRNLVVHGLSGTISCRPHQEPPSPSPVKSPPIQFHENHRQPLEHKNLTDNLHSHSTRANSSGDPNLLSPVHSQSSHSSGIHEFGSPIHSQIQSPSQSPNSEDADNDYMISEEAGEPELEGFSEAPDINLPPDVSPAYDIWPYLPEYGTFDSGIVPPPAEFSENDDPVAFPPSDYENDENQGIDKQYTESDVTSLRENDVLISPDEEGKKAIANYQGPSLLPDDLIKKEFAEQLLSYTDTFGSTVISSFKGDGSEAGIAFDYLENALGKFDDGPFFLGSLSLVSAEVDAYGKCGEVNAATRIFNDMDKKNDVSWNAMITSFAYRGCYRDALDTFRMMVHPGVVLNSITVSSILPVLAELGLLNEGRELHAFSMKMQLDIDIFVANSLIDMYAKAGNSIAATNVFDKMDVRNVVSWNTMIPVIV